MSTFLTLSPGKTVRAARWTGTGWANHYPDKMPRTEANTVRPVVMFLTGKWWSTGQYRYLFPVLDLDASSGGAAAVQRDARGLSALLAAHNIACVPVRSGPAGGMHLWTSCPAGVPPHVVDRIARLAKVLFPSLDISPLTNPTSGAVRPPGAAHRQGGHAQLAEGWQVEDAVALLRQGSPAFAYRALLRTLEVLTAAPALLSAERTRAVGPGPAPHEYTRPSGKSVPRSIAKLPDGTDRRILRTITTEDDGTLRLAVGWRPLGSRALRSLHRRPQNSPGAHQSAVHAVLTHCALNGWTAEQVRALAADAAAAPGLEWLRTTSGPAGDRYELDHAEAERRFARRWFLAVHDAARLPRRAADFDPAAEDLSEGAQAAAALLQRIEDAGGAYWQRPSGPSDRNALRVIAWHLATTGALAVTADVRRTGTLMGRAASTAGLALNRLTNDGWIETTEESVPGAGIARRIRLATTHQCPADNPDHRCAHYTATDEAAGHSINHGSDRSVNARPPKGAQACDFRDGKMKEEPKGSRVRPTRDGSARELLQSLEQTIVFQQSGVWHRLGQHAGRTLEAVERGVRLEMLTQATGYTTRTVARHLGELSGVGLVTVRQESSGTTTLVRSRRSLYMAACRLATAGKAPERAVNARVDAERHAWWQRETQWCRMPRQAKRDMGPRADAHQTLIPGMDPHDRRYPRYPGPTGLANGRPDHRTAWAIEAERINAGALLDEACQLERRGQIVDSARLGRTQAATGSVEPVAA
ncbi:hypothetical protein ACWC9H_27250 [Streptomyces sp. NPDC001251]